MPTPRFSRLQLAALAAIALGWLAVVVGARLVTPPLILAAFDGESASAWLNEKIASHKAHRAGAGFDASRAWYEAWAYGYATKATALATVAAALAATLIASRAARRRVRRFLFASAAPLNLGVQRLVAFGMLLYLLRSEKILYYASWPREMYQWPALAGPFYKFLPITPEVVGPLLGVATVAASLATVGLFTRVSAVVGVLLGYYLIGIPQLSGKVNHIHHVLMVCAVLACSRCGDALSLDALWRAVRRADRGVVAPPARAVRYGLPIRVSMLVLALVYFFPGFWKVASNGPQWVFSNNLENHLLQKWFELETYEPPIPLHKAPLSGPGGALFAVVMELGFPFALLWGWSRLAWGGMGLAFHNLTYVLMKISFVTLQAMYVVFVDWQGLCSWAGGRVFGEPIRVLYDGNCGLCRRTMGVLGVCDWLRQLRPVNALDRAAVEREGLGFLPDDDLMQDMHAAWCEGGNNRPAQPGDWGVAKGYAAYQAIAWRVPLLWPALPVVYLPPVAAVGRAIYRRVADSRACRVPTAPRGAGSPVRAALPWSWRPLAVVAGLLLGGTCLMGAARLHKAWPIACYPLFDQIEVDKAVWPEFELVAADGVRTPLDDDPIRAALGEARYVASMDALASEPVDRDGARLILGQFAKAWRDAGALPSGGAPPERVEVFRATYQLAGPRRPAAPIERVEHFSAPWAEVVAASQRDSPAAAQ